MTDTTPEPWTDQVLEAAVTAELLAGDRLRQHGQGRSPARSDAGPSARSGGLEEVRTPAQRRADAVGVWTAVGETGWWDTATVADIADVVRSAGEWAPEDSGARHALDRVHQELTARYGVSLVELYQAGHDQVRRDMPDLLVDQARPQWPATRDSQIAEPVGSTEFADLVMDSPARGALLDRLDGLDNAGVDVGRFLNMAVPDVARAAPATWSRDPGASPDPCVALIGHCEQTRDRIEGLVRPPSEHLLGALEAAFEDPTEQRWRAVAEASRPVHDVGRAAFWQHHGVDPDQAWEEGDERDREHVRRLMDHAPGDTTMVLEDAIWQQERIAAVSPGPVATETRDHLSALAGQLIEETQRQVAGAQGVEARYPVSIDMDRISGAIQAQGRTAEASSIVASVTADAFPHGVHQPSRGVTRLSGPDGPLGGLQRHRGTGLGD